MMLNLINLFDTLQSPDTLSGNKTRFSALPIPGYPRYRLGKDAQQTPSFLIAMDDELPSSSVTPIVIENLTVQYDVRCRISHREGTVEEGVFAVIQCTTEEKALQLYFLRVIDALIGSLGVTPSRRDITNTISALIELFRAITKPPKKSLQGLWAELYLIVRSYNPAFLLDAWHWNPEDKYDFNAGNQRIEVKSVAGRIRRHHFSLEQLNPPIGATILVASMFVESAGAGVSLAELMGELRPRINEKPNLLLRLERMVSLTLGDSWRNAIDERFDRELAESSLCFYEALSIPSVNPILPSLVSDVRFVSDLTDTPTADIGVYKKRGGLFRAALR